MINQNLLLAGDDGYNLTKSLRFRSSASAYLSRTPASAGNRKTWTWSGWVKRGTLGVQQQVITVANTSSNYYFYVRFLATDVLEVFDYNAGGGTYLWQLQTSQVFRDPSAYYHIQITVDTTQATASNRVKIYVNGVQVSAFAIASYPTLNFDTQYNYNGASYICSYLGTTSYLDGYLTEINSIDGQALTPSSFGSTNATTGVWQPAKYNGTYGTNGFYLPFTTNTLNTLLSTSSNISAPFGGVATNALVADGVYCTSNTSTGATFTFILNDFGIATQVTRYVITNLYFTGGTSTFAVQGSSDNSTWITFASLSVTGSAQSFSGSVNGNFRYWRLAPTAFGTNGQANVDQCVFYQDGIGLDFSSNGNNWTPNNISLTTGSTYDSMTDVPTLTSVTTANYCVLNPLLGDALDLPKDGNLKVGGTANNYSVGTIAFPTTGKFYAEATVTTYSSGQVQIGICPANATSTLGSDATAYFQNGTTTKNNVASTTLASYTQGDVIGIAVDVDNSTVQFYKNNSAQTALTGVLRITTASFFTYMSISSSVVNYNFGQQPFTYTPPSGYVALNTYNLPTSTIVKGNTVMDATTFTGTGASQSVVNTAAFKPDLVWAKSRGSAQDNWLADSNRGANNILYSNLTNAETVGGGVISSFNSNGFGVTSAFTNAVAYVGWQWQAGQGSSSSNTDGTITSTVSKNATAGFSVVTYTGTGANATIGHGLGVAPKMIIVKIRNTGGANWYVYHASNGATPQNNCLFLDSTSASQAVPTAWNNTAPTSSVFSIGTSSAVNLSTYNYVAYCWSEVAGYSQFGSYTGNGSTDGPFVYTGFRPRFVLIKNASSGTDSWSIRDSSRNAFNAVVNPLYPNLSNAEGTDTAIDFTSNGFKIRGTSGGENGSGQTMIYMAFAENPFKNALAR
jgi:hypothetical protein